MASAYLKNRSNCDSKNENGLWNRESYVNRFVSKGKAATNAIYTLVRNFPRSDEEAADRINGFVSTAVQLGYSTPKGYLENARAASLASLILTTIYPTRFVDFRMIRWEKFARALKYELPPVGTTYGAKLIWAGRFASELAQTGTYKQCWPGHDEPLWVVAGVCWLGPSPRKPVNSPINSYTVPAIEQQEALEGETYRAETTFRKRNRSLIIAKKVNSNGRCEVCGFSFEERYGSLDRDCLIAHHIDPMGHRQGSSKTRLKDLALLCPNCHAAVHTQDPPISLEDLLNRLK